MSKKMSELRIVGLEIKNHGLFGANTLTFDDDYKATVVAGDAGAGKSSFIDLIKAACSASDLSEYAIKNGIEYEVVLKDFNGIELRLGYTTKVIKHRGDKGTSNKTLAFVYMTDEEGNKITNPIIDNQKYDTKEIYKVLTTDLTFRTDALRSENQSEHKKLVLDLFQDKIDFELLKKLVEQEKTKAIDLKIKRQLCSEHGAFLTNFKEDGYTEESLIALSMIDDTKVKAEINDINFKIRSAEENFTSIIEKNISELEGKIKDKQLDISTKTNEYRQANIKLQERRDKGDKAISLLSSNKIAIINLLNTSFLTDPAKLTTLVEEEFTKRKKELEDIKASIGKDKELVFTDIDEEIKALQALIEAEKLKTFEDDSLESLQAELKVKQEALELISKTNELYSRYQYNVEWRKVKNELEGIRNDIVKLYKGVDTGVEGLIIDAEYGSDGEFKGVWMKYNGCYDPKAFHNPNGEYRKLNKHGYSQTQAAVISIMLQSSLLKDSQARFCTLDDVPHTETTVNLLNNICKDFKVDLFMSYTTTQYTEDNIPEGVILIEDGQILTK